MTKVTIQKTTHGEYLGFTCKGHAGYAQAVGTDRDIVCAAVSVLVINTLNAMEAFTDARFQTDSDEKKGLIRCRFQETPGEKAKVLLDAMVLGLTEISREYGDSFCKLKVEEV